MEAGELRLPGFSDKLLCGRPQLSFDLIRAEIAQRRMPTPLIVQGFDVIEYRRTSGFLIFFAQFCAYVPLAISRVSISTSYG